MARPTKLTPEIQARIVTAIRAGNYAGPAARSAGISEPTYYRWLERGANEEQGIYREFHDAVRRAEADAEVHAIVVIRKGMERDWRAALAYVERRYPERWRRRGANEEGPREESGLGRDAIDPKELTDAELRRLLRLHERVRARAAERS